MPATFSFLRPLTSFVAAVFTTAICHAEEVPADVFPGAHQRTPSLSEYASWINNTNEGPTEEQVLVNLDFFQWLHDEYGMVLDIYNISAGTIDKAGRYGRMDSEEFRRNFPNGFGPIYEKAKAMGTRLATWGGPDGFGDTPEEEQARIDMMVKLWREVEERLRTIGKGGGLILAPTHDVQLDTPIENLLAMLDSAKSFQS